MAVLTDAPVTVAGPLTSISGPSPSISDTLFGVHDPLPSISDPSTGVSNSLPQVTDPPLSVADTSPAVLPSPQSTNAGDGASSASQMNGVIKNDNSHLPLTGIVDIDILIVGTGPAGASLACFLSSHGITGLMISCASSSADTPRAHITNIGALECLRDLGLDTDCMNAATSGDCMMHTRWCHSMAGEEYARIYSWGNDPHRKGDYVTTSPCSPVDLPQTILEPILVRYATTHGFKCRFDTSFVAFEDQGDSGIITTLQDNISGSQYLVKSKYLFGADGARSRIMKQLAIPLIAKPGKGVAINLLVKADLANLVKHRQGNLHWVMQPDKDFCDFGYMAIVRMVKPWHEWMFILFPRPGMELNDVTRAEYLTQVKNFIGDDSITAEILDISRWTINEIVAENYAKSNVFCLGDAVHRHPPFNGLGSNTCIQDAFNLAWKISYFMKGKAGPSLLSTYSTERQPVGTSVITQANTSFMSHYHVQKALGMTEDDLAVRKAILNELSEPTVEGQKRRDFLRNAVEQTANEFHGLGVEMNQLYTGEGIFTADEPHAFQLTGPAAQNQIQHHMRSTYPGHRLPHAWINTAIPANPVSTIDLSGHGWFTIFTGIGGEAWRKAAETASYTLKLDIRVYSIGFRQEWTDVYSDWSRSREIEDSGAILVRPDRFVAWRAQVSLGDETACTEKLMLVLRSVLGLPPDSKPSS